MIDTAENTIPAKRLPLPVGNSDWAAVKAGYWSADKTQLIAGLLDRKATVALFTRPRRFGKTFAINMLQTFFEKTPESNAHLFEGTKVWADPAHRAEQGKYPVISITFKDAKGKDWTATKTFLATAIADEFRRHRKVFVSDKIDPALATKATAIADETATDELLGRDARLRGGGAAVLPQLPLRRDEGRQALPPGRHHRHPARGEGGRPVGAQQHQGLFGFR